MHPKLTPFVAEIPFNDPDKMALFQDAMDALHEATKKYIRKLALELEVGEECASDVWYLRTRSRWSEELEAKLIQLHRDGNPPNVFEWP